MQLKLKNKTEIELPFKRGPKIQSNLPYRKIKLKLGHRGEHSRSVPKQSPYEPIPLSSALNLRSEAPASSAGPRRNCIASVTARMVLCFIL